MTSRTKKAGRTAKLQHLLVAADRYGLDKLRVICERKLCESMDVETIATTLVLAEQHHCKDLKEACVEFMAPWNVLQAVMATDRWIQTFGGKLSYRHEGDIRDGVP